MTNTAETTTDPAADAVTGAATAAPAPAAADPARRRRVLLVFGGRSSEHTISCATASGVLTAIDRDRFDVVPVGITREGAWVLEDDDPAKFRLDPENLPEVVDNGTRVRLPESSLDRTVRVARPDAEGRLVEESIGEVDVVFPILHGPFGEDGTLQGYLELVGLPYVGSGVLASSAGMDKHFTKILLAAAGLRVAPGATVWHHEWRADADAVRTRIVDEFGLPLFVKPARAGSSVGVSKVSHVSHFEDAMATAFAEDDHVLVEAAVQGREVEIAVLESMPGERPRASVAGEIVMRGAEFYDFAAKYLDDSGVDLVCPADLGDDELAEMRELGIRAFEALGGSGLSRVDFFYGPDGFVVNEVNTMPGFTPISMFPKCWEATGLPYRDLISHLVEVAVARRGARDPRA